MNAVLRCRRCRKQLAVIDWTSPAAPMTADRITAAHAVDCLPKRPPARVCGVEDCGRPVTARGWCKMHWTRWKRHGNPLVVSAGGRPPAAAVEHVEPPPPREPLVAVPEGCQPVVCDRCGVPICADRTLRPDLIRAAEINHANYCREKDTAA